MNLGPELKDRRRVKRDSSTSTATQLNPTDQPPTQPFPNKVNKQNAFCPAGRCLFLSPDAERAREHEHLLPFVPDSKGEGEGWSV